MNCRVQLIGFGFSTQKDLERGYCRLGHGSRRAAPIFKAVDPASVAIERDLFSYEGCPLAGSPLGDALENTVGTEGQGGQKQVAPLSARSTQRNALGSPGTINCVAVEQHVVHLASAVCRALHSTPGLCCPRSPQSPSFLSS